MNYWTNKEECRNAAVAWNEYINNNYKAEIKECIAATELWGENREVEYSEVAGSGHPTLDVIKNTTVEAIEYLYRGNGRVAALNFASYKNPGGMFLKGSSAQEESLCHASLLYPVLKAFNSSYYAANHNNLNKALYKNKLLYSQQIPFFDRDKKILARADIITCAAPNWGTYERYNAPINVVQQRMNYNILMQRFKKLYFIAAKHNVDTLILGAWGCGVFKQNINDVVDAMFNIIIAYPTNIKHVIFAVPDEESYEVFEAKALKVRNIILRDYNPYWQFVFSAAYTTGTSLDIDPEVRKSFMEEFVAEYTEDNLNGWEALEKVCKFRTLYPVYKYPKHCKLKEIIEDESIERI